MPICFLDCEFTNLINPHLLSIGLVTLDAREHYVELDLNTNIGASRVKASSDFVRWGGALDQWNLSAGAKATDWEMGRRTGEWLLHIAAESESRLECCFDYDPDYELMASAVRNAGLWERVRDAILPVNVDRITGTIDGELAADESFRSLTKRGLGRHHALADALALRAAYISVKTDAVRLSRFTRSPDYQQLLRVASQGLGNPSGTSRIHKDAEPFLQQWLLRGSSAMDGKKPIELLEEPDGIASVERLLAGLKHGCQL